MGARTRFFAGMLAATLLLPASVRAEALTFHLSVADVLASVNRTNALLASLGKPVRGVKLVPGGTSFRACRIPHGGVLGGAQLL